MQCFVLCDNSVYDTAYLKNLLTYVTISGSNAVPSFLLHFFTSTMSPTASLRWNPSWSVSSSSRRSTKTSDSEKLPVSPLQGSFVFIKTHTFAFLLNLHTTTPLTLTFSSNKSIFCSLPVCPRSKSEKLPSLSDNSTNFLRSSKNCLECEFSVRRKSSDYFTSINSLTNLWPNLYVLWCGSSL